MKAIHQNASHIRAHTWKDIGGITGLLLDLGFLAFLLIASAFILLAGFVIVVVDYAASPFIALLSLSRRGHGTEPVLPS
jgi:hypothetical protein